MNKEELKREFTQDYLNQLITYLDKLPCASSENYSELIKDVRFKYVPGKTIKFKN